MMFTMTLVLIISSPLGLQIEMSSLLLDRFMTSSPAGWLDCDLDLDGWMVTDISA